MGFDPYKCSMKIWESIGTPTLKVKCEGSFLHTFPYSHTFGSMKCDSQASLLACTFASPCLGCKPKARVATNIVSKYVFMQMPKIDYNPLNQ
jgi:hypothetical protein